MVDGRNPRERLKNVGVPTVLVIDAPFDRIDYQAFEELKEKLSILEERGTYEVCDEGDMIDFTVSFCNGVPAAWLVRHETIREATDPIDRSRKYCYSE